MQPDEQTRLVRHPAKYFFELCRRRAGINWRERRASGTIQHSRGFLKFIMRNSFRIVTVLVLLAGMAKGQEQREQSARESLIRADNQAAVQLFKAAAEGQKERSVVIPAFSASSILWLLANGASQAGRADLEKLFGNVEMDLGGVNENLAELQAAITKPYTPSQKQARFLPPPPSPEYEPSLAIWKSSDILTASWSNIATRYYHAEELRLPHKRAVALQTVNSWLAKASGSSYAQVVTPEDLVSDFLITTASRFHGSWAIEFNVAKTKPQIFHLGNGSTRELPFMERYDDHYLYFEDNSFQSISLPYRRSEMLIFLPSESSNLQQLLERLTPENLDSWCTAINKKSREGTLQLPRFKTESAVDLQKVMEKMGATTLFHSFGSLRPMVKNIPEGARLVSVRQLTTLNVNEKETVVKSRGMMGGVIGGICGNCPPPPPPFRMVVNRPFLFVIRDSETRLILYIAAINDPSEGEAPE